MIQAFLLGVLATMFVTAGVFFLRFWIETRDSFFLAFAASFTIEGLSRVAVLFQPRPNESSPWIYAIRLLASLLILAAILKKNYGKNG
jgi:uncharacterized membrane protein HdeD (DUF308 family)